MTKLLNLMLSTNIDLNNYGKGTHNNMIREILMTNNQMVNLIT